MVKPEEFIQKSLSVQELLKQVIRMLSGILAGAHVPEFSSEQLTVSDASRLTGLPETSVRSGILYGWLPIGVATCNGRQVKGGDREISKAHFVIYPRKVWEVTGHVWRGRDALGGAK